jgi:hypothetical protein
MHQNYELLHWESGSRSSYTQIPLLDWVFRFIIRSPLKELDTVSQCV